MTNSAKTLIDAIGHNVLSQKVGISDRTLRHARSTGLFAAQWYKPIKEVAEPRGIFCPLDAFNFKSLADENGGELSARQGKDSITEAAS